MKERTVVVIDLGSKGQAEHMTRIRARYERANLRVQKSSYFRLSLANKRFLRIQGCEAFSGPIYALLIHGESAVARVRRDNLRFTKPFKAVHCSESKEEARREWLIILQSEYDDEWKYSRDPPEEPRPFLPGW